MTKLDLGLYHGRPVQELLEELLPPHVEEFEARHPDATDAERDQFLADLLPKLAGTHQELREWMCAEVVESYVASMPPEKRRRFLMRGLKKKD